MWQLTSLLEVGLQKVHGRAGNRSTQHGQRLPFQGAVARRGASGIHSGLRKTTWLQEQSAVPSQRPVAANALKGLAKEAQRAKLGHQLVLLLPKVQKGGGYPRPHVLVVHGLR